MCRHDLGNWAATSNLAPLWACLRASFPPVSGRVRKRDLMQFVKA